MADSFITTPDDAALTGKKVRTQTRVVGADTVHEHYFILQDETNNFQAVVRDDAPNPTDAGLVVRPIPSFFLAGNSSYGAKAISDTAVIIIGPDNARTFFEITNNSDKILYVGMDASVTASGATMGIAIAPGGSFSQSGDCVHQGAIYGIFGVIMTASENVAFWHGTNSF
jgi:hypothetical protein